MAKKDKASKGGKIVTISDLAEEFGIEGRKVRIVIRGLGIRAPEVKDREGFGPRAKYAFEEGTDQLKKVRAALKEAKENGADQPTKKRKPKAEKGKKEESKDEDEDEDEDEEEGDDDEDEDEDDDDEDDEDDED